MQQQRLFFGAGVVFVLAQMVLVVATSFGASDTGQADTGDASPAPGDASTGMVPEVTIIQRSDRTIREYRINGQLYMIKVAPRKGAPYYLVDTDGDGNLDVRRGELDPGLLVPAWSILRW